MRAPALLARATGALAAAGLPDAALSARYCLSKALGGNTLGTADAAVARGARLSAGQAEHLSALVARRAAREPLQYILGDWDFDVLRDVRVRPPVLIPRPETEELVGLASTVAGALLGAAGSEGAGGLGGGGGRRALHEALGLGGSGAPPPPATPPGAAHFVEVGCGSGVIGLALCKRHAGLRGVAVDVSPHAVALATENRDAQGVPADRLAVVHASYADLGTGGGGGGATRGPFPLLVSNPPYVPDGAIAGLQPEVRQWEDHGALAGGPPHGLGFTLDMLAAADARGWLAPGGMALLETDATHPAMLAWLLLRGRRSLPATPTPGSPPLTLAVPPASGYGAPSPGAAVVDVAAAVGSLPPSDRAALEGVAAGASGARLAAAWRLAAAFSDYAGVPRFVALRYDPPAAGEGCG